MPIKNFILSSLFLTWLSVGTSIYDIEVESAIGNKPVSLAQFKGQKLLITTISVEKESQEKITYLKGLLSSDKELQIIAVPARDEDSRKVNGESVSLSEIKATGMLVTKPVNVLKKSGYEQHALFKWLTNSELNGHFDAERENTGEYFLVSDSGLLYAVLPANVPKIVLEDALRAGGKE